jgi:hypothetical protein
MQAIPVRVLAEPSRSTSVLISDRRADAADAARAWTSAWLCLPAPLELS